MAEADASAPAGKAEIVAAALADLEDALADLEEQAAAHPGQAVMVGDRAQDVAGAAANGLECIGVGWGFALDGELREAGAAEIVHSTEALHESVLRRDAAGVDGAARSEVPANAHV
jgi:phosphoglycolate phosphatase